MRTLTAGYGLAPANVSMLEAIKYSFQRLPLFVARRKHAHTSWCFSNTTRGIAEFFRFIRICAQDLGCCSLGLCGLRRLLKARPECLPRPNPLSSLPLPPLPFSSTRRACKEGGVGNRRCIISFSLPSNRKLGSLEVISPRQKVGE